MSPVTPAPDSDMNSVESRLDLQDWDFPSRRSAGALESIHPYPAKFIPDLPGTLMDVLSIPPETTILDPFVGGGTTLVEAQRRGFRSVGVDLNPIACLISRVKTARAPERLSEVARAVLDDVKDLDPEVRTDIPNIDHWFRRDVQIELARLVTAISRVPKSHEDALRLALSAIVVRVSNQESDTRYAAIDKSITGSDVSGLFLTSVQKIEDALTARHWPLASASVLNLDAREIGGGVLSGPIGAIITSPPYPNAYEYWLYHKYRMYWLGYDPQAVKQREIGARPHFFKKNPHTPQTFFLQMSDVLGAATKNLVSSGWVCIVVGRSMIQGVHVDNSKIVQNVAQELGLKHIKTIDRVIAASSKSFNLAHARIKSEEILVFRKS